MNTFKRCYEDLQYCYSQMNSNDESASISENQYKQELIKLCGQIANAFLRGEIKQINNIIETE